MRQAPQRPLLHPLATALLLLAMGGLAGMRALTAGPGSGGAAVATVIGVAVAGAAAGFANSGST